MNELGYFDRDGNPITPQRYEQLISRGIEYRRVEQTKVGDVVVSTVWLGRDHNFGTAGPPLIFETMVFGGLLDNSSALYASEDLARTEHQRWVACVKSINALIHQAADKPAEDTR